MLAVTLTKPRSPTLIDLFCGAGGISHGFESAGFAVVAGVDSDADSIATFRHNHTDARGVCADLSSVSAERLADELGIRTGEIDCIAGGPPCQGFSRNRSFRRQEGRFVDDPRNYLYWHFFRIIDHLKPKVVVMENVPEILTAANGYFYKEVVERFESMGYLVGARVLNGAGALLRTLVRDAALSGCGFASFDDRPGRRHQHKYQVCHFPYIA